MGWFRTGIGFDEAREFSAALRALNVRLATCWAAITVTVTVTVTDDGPRFTVHGGSNDVLQRLLCPSRVPCSVLRDRDRDRDRLGLCEE